MAPDGNGVELHLEHIIDCPFSEVVEYAEEFLRRLRQAAGPGTLRFSAQSDLTERGKPHDELFVRWRAASTLIADLDLVVRFRIHFVGTRVLVDVRHCVGARHAVESVIRELIDRLCADAEEREHEYRLRHTLAAAGPAGARRNVSP
jgi:hypothetical protein